MAYKGAVEPGICKSCFLAFYRHKPEIAAWLCPLCGSGVTDRAVYALQPKSLRDELLEVGRQFRARG